MMSASGTSTSRDQVHHGVFARAQARVAEIEPAGTLQPVDRLVQAHVIVGCRIAVRCSAGFGVQNKHKMRKANTATGMRAVIPVGFFIVCACRSHGISRTQYVVW